jgi:hypothetical protein
MTGKVSIWSQAPIPHLGPIKINHFLCEFPSFCSMRRSQEGLARTPAREVHGKKPEEPKFGTCSA